jgi:hypothetical protein
MAGLTLFGAESALAAFPGEPGPIASSKTNTVETSEGLDRSA